MSKKLLKEMRKQKKDYGFYLMTVSQVRKAARQYRFLILRTDTNKVLGVNAKSIFTKKNNEWHGNAKTDFVSFKPCSFNEYITKKVGFI